MVAVIVKDASAEEIAALVFAVQERQRLNEIELAKLKTRRDALDAVQSRSAKPPCER